MTGTQNATVVALFDTHEQAERAVRELVNAGVPRDRISLMANNSRSGIDVGGGTKKTADGTSIGENIAGGALFGGLGGLLIGLGALAIPGLGPIVAAGPIATTLAGAGIGAAGGGVIGALKDAGVPDDEANLYAEGVRRGGTLVSVSTDNDMVDRVSDILDDAGAIDVDERGQQYRTGGWTRFDEHAGPYQPATTTESHLTADRPTKGRSTKGRTKDHVDTGTEKVIPVVEEQLSVGKRETERGRVRVFSHVQERPVEEQVTLREEHARVERRPADRPVTDADNLFQEGTIEVRESVEQPVVQKQARVVEEVVVGKETRERTETVRDTVRRTDVDVQEDRGAGITGTTTDYDTDFRTHYQSTFGSRGRSYDVYAPAYQYGYRMASDERYRGRNFNDVEMDLRRDYERNNPGSTWDDIKDAVRYGWGRVTGRR